MSEPVPASGTESTEVAPRPTRSVHGPRLVLAVVYGIFALAATSRAAVQIATKFHEAPLAYLLSAFSGVVYIAATVGLLSTRQWSRPLTFVACSVELLGVLVIGTASLIDTEAFPHDTVWSKFGYGYVFIPVVLPIAGLWWLLRSRSTAEA